MKETQLQQINKGLNGPKEIGGASQQLSHLIMQSR